MLLDVEESLALRASKEPATLVVLNDASDAIRFYASVKLFDAAGMLRGTLALIDDRARTLSDLQRDLLIRVAAQLSRDLELIDLVDVFRRPEYCPDVARDAVAAGAKALWLQSGIVSPEAREIAEAAGLDYMEDECAKVVHLLHLRLSR